LTEGIDQTRGWAYTLLIENVILNNKPIAPFRSFLFQGHVLDKNGNKMSKSLGNCIYLSDTEVIVNQKIRAMFTDPTHLRISDPGHVENNPVFIYLDAFHQNAKELDELKAHYQRGGLGDVALKQILAKDIGDFLEPIRERRDHFKAHPELVRQALIEGTLRAKKIAEKTMLEVRDAMGITHYEDSIK